MPSLPAASSRWFAQSSVILFLNKTDLFKAKLITSPIYEFYSDYEGPSDYPTASAYMESKFTPLYRNHEARPLTVLFTCATDTEQLRVVFNAVEQQIMRTAIEELVSLLAYSGFHRCIELGVCFSLRACSANAVRLGQRISSAPCGFDKHL